MKDQLKRMGNRALYSGFLPLFYFVFLPFERGKVMSKSIESLIHEMFLKFAEPIVAAIEATDAKIDGVSAPAIDEHEVTKIVQQEIAKRPATKVECIAWDKKKRSQDDCHPDTPILIAKLQHASHHDRNLYCYGPAGTGKTTAGIKVAELLGLKLHIQGTAMSKYDLLGFRLPSGEVVRTAFMDAWEHGGMIILDDIDRSDPKALSALNAATANGTCDFSHCGLGLIPRHPDCVIFATGNTSMNGQDVKYVAASKQDGAFRDRFTFHQMLLNEAFELNITAQRVAAEMSATAIKWTKRIQKIRAACKKLGGNVDNLVMASMRASIQGSDLLATGAMTQAQIEESVVFKGAGKDVTTMVYKEVGNPSNKTGQTVINFD